jgi:hypothetical protein
VSPRVKYLFVESYEEDDEDAVEALKSTYKNRLEEVCWKNNEFKVLYDQVGDAQTLKRAVSGHSVRKFASDYVQKKGATETQTEHRG